MSKCSHNDVFHPSLIDPSPDKPQLEGSSHPEPITVQEGDPLQLNCSAVGNPAPSYTWTLPSGSPSASNGSVLTIDSATFADEGMYTCSVGNVMGTVTVEMNVDVQGESCPVFTGSGCVAFSRQTRTDSHTHT